MDIWISMLEHYAYCPRQCALIHLEQTYDENIFTIRGSLMHERVDKSQSLLEKGIRIERRMWLWSEKLGIRGISDVVEFHGDIPYPVEYKSSKLMKRIYHLGAEIQLCAQGLCLEEMLNVPVEKGAIFYKGSQRRNEIIFTDSLRLKTQEIVKQVREMLKTKLIAKPVNDNRCHNCSLIDSCLPMTSEQKRMNHISSELFQCKD